MAKPGWKREYDERWSDKKNRRRYWILLSFIPICACLLIISEVVGRPGTVKVSKAAIAAAWKTIKDTPVEGTTEKTDENYTNEPHGFVMSSSASHSSQTATSVFHPKPAKTHAAQPASDKTSPQLLVSTPKSHGTTASNAYDTTISDAYDKTAPNANSGSSNISAIEPTYVDNGHGLISGLAKPFYSPNHQFRLQHLKTGDLTLEGLDPISTTWTPLWSSNTGSLSHGHTKGKAMLRLDRQGKLRIEIGASDSTAKSIPLEIWHSDLSASCGLHPIHPAYGRRRRSAAANANPQLRLSNDGRLDTLGATGDVHCVLFPGVSTSWYKKDQYGKLALLVSGLDRSLEQTCKSHHEAIVHQWPGYNVDVFFYSFYGSADTVEQEKQLVRIRDCYGPNLKDVKLEDGRNVTVRIEQLEKEMPGNCRGVDQGRWYDMLEELRMVKEGAELMRGYSLKTGTKYDAVARIRPDTLLKGEVAFERPKLLGAEKVVVPALEGQKYRYCSAVDGGVQIGAADQLFYGHPVAAGVWLDLYHHLPTLLKEGQKGKAMSSYSGCEKMPSGTDRKCADEGDTCSLDCIVSYYLNSRGIETKVDWAWGTSEIRS